MVHEEWRIRSALQTRHKLKEFSFETEEYKVKRDGTLKSRLCVQGCRQVAGVDYDQTWCGAMRGTSLRLLSNLAAQGDMRIRRFDFVAAYLQGELLEGEF